MQCFAIFRFSNIQCNAINKCYLLLCKKIIESIKVIIIRISFYIVFVRKSIFEDELSRVFLDNASNKK